MASQNNNTGLSIVQLNCRSLNNKLGEIKLLLYTLKPDILALSETWVTNCEPRFYNYTCEWRHRGGRGGGLGFVMRRGVQYRKINLLPFDNGVLECQAIEVILEDRSKLSVLNLYNPNLNVTKAEVSHFLGQLGTKYMIVGDLNAHTHLLSTNCQRSNATGRMLNELLSSTDICLANPLDFYTHLDSSTGQQSCLDLCLTSSNIASGISLSQLREVGSDHLPILIKFDSTPASIVIQTRRKWKITRENLKAFSENIPPSSLIKPSDIDSIAEDFSRRLNDSASQNIERTSGKIKTTKSAHWWDSECAEKVKQRNRARKNLIRNPCIDNICLLYTSPSPRDKRQSRMPSSA